MGSETPHLDKIVALAFGRKKPFSMDSPFDSEHGGSGSTSRPASSRRSGKSFSMDSPFDSEFHPGGAHSGEVRPYRRMEHGREEMVSGHLEELRGGSRQEMIRHLISHGVPGGAWAGAGMNELDRLHREAHGS